MSITRFSCRAERAGQLGAMRNRTVRMSHRSLDTECSPMTRLVDFRTYLAALFALCLGASMTTVMRADENDDKATATTATEERPEEYKNWIELAIGGVILDGDRAQFEQEHRLPGNQVFGGIEDLHYEHAIGSD